MKKYLSQFLLILIIGNLFITCKPKNIPAVFDAKAIVDTNFNNQWKGIAGFANAQNAYSLLLPNHSILWFYNNAHINDAVSGQVPCDYTIHNAAVLENNGSYTILNSSNLDFIKSSNSAFYYHTMCAFIFGDTIFAFCKKSDALYNNTSYVAKISYPNLQFLKMDTIQHTTTIGNDYEFNDALVCDTLSGFTYHYGTMATNADGLHHLIIARHSLDNPHKHWTYFNGTTWVDDVTQSKNIFSETNKPMCIRKIKKYYVLTAQDYGPNCANGLNIYSYISSEAWGPFNGTRKLFTVPQNFNNYQPNVQNANIQPSYIDGSNQVLITYSLYGYDACTTDCFTGLKDVNHTATFGFRVPLNSINPVW